MFTRWLDLRPLVARKSVLLLGPRMTGKSTLLRATFPDALVVDRCTGRLGGACPRVPSSSRSSSGRRRRGWSWWTRSSARRRCSMRRTG